MNESSATTVSAKSSICLWLFRPFSIIITCAGLVMFVAGITSFSIHGDASGHRILLTPVGGFLLSFGVLLAIGIQCRVRLRERERQEELRPNSDIVDLTSEFASANISTEATSPGMWRHSPVMLPTCPGPHRNEDIPSARSISPLVIDMTCLVNIDEVLLSLENPEAFEVPPSYEEAMSLA